MNHYYTSDGQRVAKSVIDSRVKAAKKIVVDEQKNEHGYNFCVECGRSTGVRLDCSHTISVDYAQKTRRTELAWDTDNIKIRCRDCHIKHDSQSKL